MKIALAAMVVCATAAVAAASAQRIEISSSGTRSTARGAAEQFTGVALIEPLFAPRETTKAGASLVTFTPGARTFWHSHPAGQTLVVTSGSGWVQEWNGERRQLSPGDVVWTPAGVKHWHGATKTATLSHIAVQENVNGKFVEWMEPVSEAQYGN